MYLYTIDISYACFCIEVENGVVVHAPGIAKWTIGKDWEEVEEHYVSKKNAKITKTRI